jgi:hypothetical protein
MEDGFLGSSVPLKTVMATIEKQFHSVSGDAAPYTVLFEAFIGDMTSLIYFPIFIEGRTFHDGILGEPLAKIPEEFVDDLLSFNQQKDWRIEFVPTLCPNCGWDLVGERDSVVLFCKNCDSAWEASQMRLGKVEFGAIPSEEVPAAYLPFWVMKARVEELKIRSYADLLRVANVPKVMKKEWEELDLSFWAPAFKVPPQIFLGLTTRMTISQPREPFEQCLPKAPLYPVTLPLSEALESIKVTIAHAAIDKQGIFPRLSEVSVQLDKSVLVYVPFRLCGNEFIHSQTQSCVHKNFLKLGRDL